MSTFNGSAIAGYLRSIFLAKQNIGNALVAKGVNLDGVLFNGLANKIDPSIPVRPIPDLEPPIKPVEPIVKEYAFTINGQPPDVMKGTGTFNLVDGTFTGEIGEITPKYDVTSRYECGSDASCAWNNAYAGGGFYGRVGVENLPITLESA